MVSKILLLTLHYFYVFMPEGRSAYAHIKNSSVNFCLNQNPVYRICGAYAYSEASETCWKNIYC